MTMNCERFRSMLDRYIDSELSEEERSAMEEHTLSCDDCAELLNQALTTATMCAELNEGLTVPLECQAGWRRAVREEFNWGVEEQKLFALYEDILKD